jgi:hypothetical protein
MTSKKISIWIVAVGTFSWRSFACFAENLQKKNKEHVLPQWLLRETGDPTRVVKMGIWFAIVCRDIG